MSGIISGIKGSMKKKFVTGGATGPVTDFTTINATSPSAVAYIAMPGGTRTLLNYLQSFGINGSSSNSGSGQWSTSFSGNITYLGTPTSNNNYFTQYGRVRVVDGDGSADGLDWGVFNFGIANCSGDFDGSAGSQAYFGGENSYSGGTGGAAVSTGYVWGYNPTASSWVLLYQLGLGTSSGSTCNHTNGYWFTSGGAVASGIGKRSDYDNTSISHIGFSVN